MKKVLIILGLLPLWIVLAVAGRACTTAGQIADRTFDGDNVIFQYEWFKQQAQDYKAIEVKKDRAQASVDQFKEEAGPRKEWTWEDKQECSRLQSIADGLGYQCEDIKSKYNARSTMINRNIFKDNKLPHQL